MTIETVPSLMRFFRLRVDETVSRRAIDADDASRDYLAQLLETVGTGSGADLFDGSLVLRLDDALGRGPGDQIVALQSVGDAALYLVSFFPEHIARAGLDAGLYINVGRFAYGRAAGILTVRSGNARNVLTDLGQRFGTYADVLADIAQSSALGGVTRDVVRLFDRWKQTGSTVALEAMARIGAFPAPGNRGAC